MWWYTQLSSRSSEVLVGLSLTPVPFVFAPRSPPSPCKWLVFPSDWCVFPFGRSWSSLNFCSLNCLLKAVRWWFVDLGTRAEAQLFHQNVVAEDDSGGKMRFTTNKRLFKHFWSVSADWASSTLLTRHQSGWAYLQFSFCAQKNKIKLLLGLKMCRYGLVAAIFGSSAYLSQCFWIN